MNYPPNSRNSIWGAKAALGVVLVLIICGVVYAFSTADRQYKGTDTEAALTGQATSSSGSSMVGAPPGTQPKETSGQASSPAGTNTTGAAK